MRFLMLMHPDPAVYEGDFELTVEDVTEMNAYNEELVKAGVLLAADGLAPPVEGARVRRSGVTDGPFAEAKEVVGGYWIIQAGSREEAIEWARRCPIGERDMIEVRRIPELEDYDPEIQEAATLSQDLPEQTTG